MVPRNSSGPENHPEILGAAAYERENMAEIMKVEGIGYEPADIEQTRQALIEYRKRAMEQWPESIEFTLVLTDVIAQLAYLKEARQQGLC